MEFLFGARKKPEEMLRQNQRALNRAIRELDRERTRLENQEKKLLVDMKAVGKKGEMEAVKIMARDVVKTRRFVKKFILMRANIQALSLQIQTLKSNSEMANAMKGVSKALTSMNSRMKLPEIQRIMANFEKESDIVDMKQEMMEEAIDEVTGEVEDDEESEAMVSKVLDEIGISSSNEIQGLPTSSGKPRTGTGRVVSDVSDLETRLEKLREQ